MSGPAILVTPVLAPLAVTVDGVFPGVGKGTRWYDYYNLTEVVAAPGQNVTLAAPLTHQPVHVRGGYIIPQQRPGNTTTTTRKSPYTLLVALDSNSSAKGDLYLDDGISLIQPATKTVQLAFSANKLSANISGAYNDGLPLANLTFAGLRGPRPSGVKVTLDGVRQSTAGVAVAYGAPGAVYVTGLEQATRAGVWSGNLTVELVYGNGAAGPYGPSGVASALSSVESAWGGAVSKGWTWPSASASAGLR